MEGEKKRAQLTFAGGEPMKVTEVPGTTPEPWTPQQQEAAEIVFKAIGRYLKSTKTLAAEKYAHLREKLPGYLIDPGNVLIVVCLDGIVVRFEAKISAERHMLAVAVMNQRISAVASLVSQNLVSIESPESPPPSRETFGVEVRLSVATLAGVKKDLAVKRIWFQAKYAVPPGEPLLGAKPFCLLSVRNQMVLEIHGELLSEVDNGRPNLPFVTRSAIRLQAGWDCIEVFPGFRTDVWQEGFAPLWAENDLLGAALIAHTQEAQLSTLDPRAAARRQYAALLAEFRKLLDSNPNREQILQTYLQENPILLCPTYNKMWPKLAIGAKFTDFVFCDASNEYLLVELESADFRLFRKNGHPTSELTHAQGQVVDWKRYLEDNLPTAQRELGLAGITTNPNGLIVIGRAKTLSNEDRRKLQAMANETPKLKIMTYDDLYEHAKRVIENLLGPIWDVGGTTEVFYPQSAEGPRP
jgi:hypothetical protein